MSLKLCTFAPMEQDKNSRDIVQSYIITTAKYKFTPTEKRIMYRIIEAGQDLLEGRKLRGHIKIQSTLYKDKDVYMKYSDVNAENNPRLVRKALLALLEKKVVWDNAKGGGCTLIERPEWDEQRGWFSCRVHPKIWDAMLLQLKKGFRKYQLAIAMSFSSVYSMRLYELISGQKSPLSYKITDLKAMLGLEQKYKRLYDFQKRVLDVAKVELDKVADYGFDYTIKGKKDPVITFLPYSMHRGSNAELNRVKREMHSSWFLPSHIISYLKQKGFTEKEIKTHLELFSEVCTTLDDPLITIAEVTANSRDKHNPKGYVINALKGKVNDVKKRQERASTE